MKFSLLVLLLASIASDLKAAPVILDDLSICAVKAANKCTYVPLTSSEVPAIDSSWLPEYTPGMMSLSLYSLVPYTVPETEEWTVNIRVEGGGYTLMDCCEGVLKPGGPMTLSFGREHPTIELYQPILMDVSVLFSDSATGESRVVGDGQFYFVTSVPEPATVGPTLFAAVLMTGGVLLVRRRKAVR